MNVGQLIHPCLQMKIGLSQANVSQQRGHVGSIFQNLCLSAETMILTAAKYMLLGEVESWTRLVETNRRWFENKLSNFVHPICVKCFEAYMTNWRWSPSTVQLCIGNWPITVTGPQRNQSWQLIVVRKGNVVQKNITRITRKTSFCI